MEVFWSSLVDIRTFEPMGKFISICVQHKTELTKQVVSVDNGFFFVYFLPSAICYNNIM